ncbi:MAG TPA: DUF2934 domain-containing protein [Vicinamibacterales bacterium]|nr:DUF2934 domain-containing protein [Vicinamibacterales bacterium]
MARTTKKIETPGTAKPAVKRRTASAPAAAVEKVTTRRRTKTQSEGLPPMAVADNRPSKAVRSAAGRVPEPTHEEIAVRAYYLSERRRGWHGSPEQDWLQAVTELRRERGIL